MARGYIQPSQLTPEEIRSSLCNICAAVAPPKLCPQMPTVWKLIREASRIRPGSLERWSASRMACISARRWLSCLFLTSQLSATGTYDSLQEPSVCAGPITTNPSEANCSPNVVYNSGVPLRPCESNNKGQVTRSREICSDNVELDLANAMCDTKIGGIWLDKPAAKTEPIPNWVKYGAFGPKPLPLRPRVKRRGKHNYPTSLASIPNTPHRT